MRAVTLSRAANTATVFSIRSAIASGAAARDRRAASDSALGPKPRLIDRTCRPWRFISQSHDGTAGDQPMLGSPSLRLELEQQTRLDDRVFPSEWWRERDHAPECSEPIARGIRRRPSPQLSRPPRPVVASCLGTTTGGQNGPPRARRQRRARQIHLVPLLPGVGLIGLLRRWGIDRIMQPPVPIRRHLRRLGLFGIDDPASRSSKRANALGLLKIAVTELVGADESAAQPRIDSVAPGVAAPPAEDLAHDAHKRATRRPRLPDSL